MDVMFETVWKTVPELADLLDHDLLPHVAMFVDQIYLIFTVSIRIKNGVWGS